MNETAYLVALLASDTPEEAMRVWRDNPAERQRALNYVRAIPPASRGWPSEGDVLIVAGVLRGKGVLHGKPVFNQTAQVEHEAVAAALKAIAPPLHVIPPASLGGEGTEPPEDTINESRCEYCGDLNWEGPSNNCRVSSGHSWERTGRTLYVYAALRATPPREDRAGAIADIAAERERQKSVEGWTAEHDDEHKQGQMAKAAAAYSYFGSLDNSQRATGDDDESYTHFLITRLFPVWGTSYGGWGWHWWKPKDRRRDLIRAAALIVAEIERLDRAALLPSGEVKI